MNAFFASLLALIIITAGANAILTSMPFSSADVYSTSNVRLGE